ncbi:MAG: MobF family relaxase, partial [Acidimicrobiales bacterium]
GGEGVVGYYADSMAAPGIWMGHGLTGAQLDGMVDPAQLQRVLLGQNPVTGDQLVGGNGSAQRAHADQVRRALRGPGDEVLSLADAADAVGVSASYLRQQAATTRKARAVQARQRVAGEELSPLPSSHLDAKQAGPGGPWWVTRAELRRFAAERTAPPVVIGYDLTFSPPKSVSVLWATASPAQRVAIESALTDAVRVGVAYLEENAAHVRVSVSSADGESRRLERHSATGLVAAAYLHDTSRALDPQLHFHVVAANMGEAPDGRVRALDGRGLFLHAKTAGYLSGAELRHRLSLELGVAWGPVHRGLADIDGVPREAIAEMSQRARQMDEHISAMAEHAPTTARGRQVAAYDTRASKDAVDADALRPSWERRLADAGFDRAAIDACYGRRRGPEVVDGADREELFGLMASPRGVTELAATFDRRDALQFVAAWAGDRLGAADIEELADTWLTRPEVVRLDDRRADTRSADVIQRADGRIVRGTASEAAYTTTQMLAVEAAITSLYEAGRSAGVGVVPPDTLAAVLAQRPHLGEDQVEMVRSITASGHRAQPVYGPAGSGKTTALEAAARAWEAAGYTIIGAAVQGTAAEIVGDRAKVANATVASVLARVG